MPRVHASDVVVALTYASFLAAVTQIASGSAQPEPSATASALAFGSGIVFAVRRPLPEVTFLGALACVFVYTLRDDPGGPIYLSAFAATAVLVAARPRPVWIPFTIAGAAAVVVAGVISTGWQSHYLIVGVLWLGSALLLSENLRNRGAKQEEVALRRVAEERLRIAREVHDVVGHALATISLQAGVAERLLDERPEQARESLRAIRQASKQSLGGLRHLLGLESPDGTPAERAPTPDLDAIPRLVETMRDAGLAVELETIGTGAHVPGVVGAAAYRIVQESLTNVVRHAGEGAKANVRVTVGDQGVVVDVADDGRGARQGELRPGGGLTGMEERAAALGGSFRARPRARGGFAVRAVLPTGRAAERARVPEAAR
jgi:signal transduction histidine kinase